MNSEEVKIINGKKRRNRVEVFAISDSKILAYSKGINSYLELPGGAVNEGETIIEAGLRELAEEAGWPATNAKIINIPGEHVFIENENSWLKQHGVDEEVNSAISCNVTEFRPTQLYGSEDDSYKYTLLSIDQVISETINTFQNSTDKRGKYIAKYRLNVLQILLNTKISITLESKPNFIKW